MLVYFNKTIFSCKVVFITIWKALEVYTKLPERRRGVEKRGGVGNLQFCKIDLFLTCFPQKFVPSLIIILFYICQHIDLD